MTVAVVTDSSAVVPSSWIARLPIRIVSIEIAWADGSLDRGNLTYSAIAERLEAERTPPKTGAPAPGIYAELITELLTDHDGVLIVCPSSEFSTTYSSAILGARELGDPRVRVLDSKTAAAGQGMAAAEAGQLAATGADVDAVCNRAIAVASKMQIWATLSQLAFLARSGRVPAIAAVGAGALGLQPIVRYVGMSPSPAGVTRSTERGADRLFRAWQRSFVDCAKLRAVAFHSARDDDARTICRRIKERVPDGRVESTEVTASLAAHTGPGLLGLAWFWDD